ncbi:hypothetical protein CS063_07515 [Sporanaerobium hydrogeniformans]|uniref:Uncharacterized protein n=1 Tax=Sporanaerobium hydrogeniformans TaxID=3072179 RepID=A0AC61DD87_9FIRM|nr:ribonuclease H-like domain-containing protein [Sporanaerobium hydrogeniformans]PHV71169.1 hypothetical protein CS063_07515 [Sporanaerobium hydrogeniformans]
MLLIEKPYPYPLVSMSPSEGLIDIETTGLIGRRDTLISLGITYKETTGTLLYRQWVAEKQSEEKELLLAFLEWAKSFKTFYSYNGNSFDWPFIRARLIYHAIEDTLLENYRFLDLKKLLKKISPIRQELEKLLGFTRQSTLTGKELVKLYTLYEKTHVANYLKLLLDHQKDELLSLGLLYALYQLLSHLEETTISSTEKQDDFIILFLELREQLISTFYINSPYFYIEGKSGQNRLLLRFKCQTLLLYHYLSPAKDYYFIPSQNQLIHKSIAQFIPAEMKQKVKKDACYLTKTSSFLPLCTTQKCSLPLWQDQKGHFYVEYTPDAILGALLIKQVYFYLFL